MIFKEYFVNKNIKRAVDHIFYLIILLVLIPVFFYFELSVVLPVVVEAWTVTYIFHVVCATFLLSNIISNMIFGMFTNSSIQGKVLDGKNKQAWKFCSFCECMIPERAWHCDTCNICILKRDHHCTFLASCVGYYNQRYFIWFTLYIFFSMLYAFYFNIYFLSTFLTWDSGFVIIKFVFPLASFVIDFGYESLYVFLVVINFVVAMFSGFLSFYHLNNVIKGKITPESKNEMKVSYDQGIKSNLIEVFGNRWYLTWISAFVKSPLPGNGMEWPCENKNA